MRQGDVGDGAVERLHDGRQHDRPSDHGTVDGRWCGTYSIVAGNGCRGVGAHSACSSRCCNCSSSSVAMRNFSGSISISNSLRKTAALVMTLAYSAVPASVRTTSLMRRSVGDGSRTISPAFIRRSSIATMLGPSIHCALASSICDIGRGDLAISAMVIQPAWLMP